MSKYLARLNAKIQKTSLPHQVPKVTEGVFVPFGTDGDRDVCRTDDAEPDPFVTFGTDKRKRFRPIECAKQETAAIRPKRYTDAEWLAAIADARRLGYPPKEDGR